MEAILGFEPIGIIAGICRKPHYIWGYTKEGVKVCKKTPTIPDVNYPDSFGMSPDDKLVVRETIEEVMTHFEAEGFVMPDEDVWDFPEKAVRIKMTDRQNTLLMQSPYGVPMLQYFKSMDPPAPTVNRNTGIYIYLAFIEDGHRYLLSSPEIFTDGQFPEIQPRP